MRHSCYWATIFHTHHRHSLTPSFVNRNIAEIAEKHRFEIIPAIFLCRKPMATIASKYNSGAQPRQRDP